MFDLLFVKPCALARHSAEPLPDERSRFLAHLNERGLPRGTLRWYAETLLKIADALRLADRQGEMISRDEINRCATDMASVDSAQDDDQTVVTLRRIAKNRHKFSSVATRWLRYLGRLQLDQMPASPYAEQIEAFAEFLKREQGLEPIRKPVWQ